ncbi:glycoside hydrolase family 3 N-terminal domain-containing protein [Pseudodesulfovibrio sp. zrk46]|uniref:glycoside hydrolase family 3 protein n=1 Tax=Pseudodesulfovibrio sp. zrk46 TaxID=2725288 RepID=UPI001FFD24D9|nr:glycoside hydrolase family 3 N-terminal domain-containing protein [Pseudodesulfovibrio sp. zrk46]
MFARLLLSLLILLLTAIPSMAADLDTMIGQMLLAGFRGYTVDAKSPIIRDIRDYHLGGVILFDYDVELGKPERNIKSPEQVSKLTEDLDAAASLPLFISVDQEGGRVQRLKPAYGFPSTPSAQELGAGEDERVLLAGRSVGRTLQDAGFNVDFAPVADVNVDPDSPAIGKIGRSFSADPNRVALCDRLFLHGLAENYVIGCLKHFPGHGSAGADSHLGMVDVTQTWSEAELIPYRKLIGNGTAKMIMTAHIFNAKLDPKYPATLSHKVITGILRDQLGYNGVVVTDDMNMRAITDHYGQEEAIRLAIEAGADILLFGNNLRFDPDIVPKAHGIIKQLVKDGKVSEARIAQSYARIMRLKDGMD